MKTLGVFFAGFIFILFSAWLSGVNIDGRNSLTFGVWVWANFGGLLGIFVYRAGKML